MPDLSHGGAAGVRGTVAIAADGAGRGGQGLAVKGYRERPKYAQHNPLQRLVATANHLRVLEPGEKERGKKPHRLPPRDLRVAAEIEHRARTQRKYTQISVGFGGLRYGRKGETPRPAGARPGLAEATGMSRSSVISGRNDIERHGLVIVNVGGRGKGGRNKANTYAPGVLFSAEIRAHERAEDGQSFEKRGRQLAEMIARLSGGTVVWPQPEGPDP